MRRRFELRVVLLLAMGAACAERLPAQMCTVSIAGLNRLRRVVGAVHAECPGSVHTAPFGNWGATSNYGKRRNGHQFDGWCHNTWVCDDWGNCRTDCTEGWYEWNSCTDIPQFQAPNCSLYNSASCTEQVSATDVNVLGTVYVNARVSCPFDSDGDGFCDSGGCRDVASITATTNYMSLYELDPICCDDLVQSVYFSQTTVNLSCNPWGCGAAGSDWVTPTFYDSPGWPPKVDAQVATIANWGKFSDPNGVCAYYAQFDRRFACY